MFPEMMCDDCTCCRAGNCTTLGRWSGYCSSVCPCRPFDNHWYDDDGDDYDPLNFTEDDE